VYAETPAPKEPIVVNGDKVEYFHEKKEVVGSGNVSITYRDVVLTCDEIKVNLDTREGEATGNVKVTQKDAFLKGEKITYNFDTKRGSIIEGYVDAKPFYGKAQSVEKLANKEQVNMERGYITTCNLDKPHYRVQSREVRIYLDDKVIAKHILLFVGNVPVLYMPYYVQPLKQGKTHVTVIPGESKDWGYYVLTAYRYYLDDINRGDILLDYRSKKGIGAGINHYYDTKRIGDGTVKFYYTHENDRLAYEKTGETKSRYRFQVRHRWDVGGQTDTVGTFEFNKLKDRDVIKDYFYNEFEELGDIPDNYLSFVTQKRDYSTEFLIRKRFDKFYTVVERLPEYRIDIPNWRLYKGLPIYYKANASAVYLNKTFDNTNMNPGQKDVSTARVDVYNQLSYAARFFKSLSVTPYGGIENTYYYKNKWGTANEIRTIFNAGVDNSIKFYKIYDVKTNFLNLDINRLRHIITPTANYYFTHQPTISPDNLNQFDSIDDLTEKNGIRFAIENRLQTKRYDGKQMKSVDLATFIVSTDYMFRLKKHSAAIKSEKFNSVNLELELIPYSWAYMLAKMSINTKNCYVETESVDLVAHGGDDWSLAIGHRFEKAESGTTNLVTLDGIYKINEKWKVRAYERYNTTKGALEEHEYTVARDFHCWIAELTYNIKDNDNQTLWFVMKLKAFPEYSIGLKRTYSRPRFGSVGAQ
jgi:LPS-assembly protein